MNTHVHICTSLYIHIYIYIYIYIRGDREAEPHGVAPIYIYIYTYFVCTHQSSVVEPTRTRSMLSLAPVQPRLRSGLENQYSSRMSPDYRRSGIVKPRV